MQQSAPLHLTSTERYTLTPSLLEHFPPIWVEPGLLHAFQSIHQSPANRRRQSFAICFLCCVPAASLPCSIKQAAGGSDNDCASLLVLQNSSYCS